MLSMSVTNEETTEINYPDPDLSKTRVPNHCIIVRPVHIEGKTKGGIILANKTQNDVAYLMNICKVLKVGETAYTQDMFTETGPWCKEGDFVLIPRISGQKFKFKGVPLTMIACDKVLLVLNDPKDVDPMFNIGVN